MASNVGELVKKLGVSGPRDEELKRLLREYGTAMKRGDNGAASKAERDIVRHLGMEECDKVLVDSFMESLRIVDGPSGNDAMMGGGFGDLSAAVLNFMKGLCGGVGRNVDDVTKAAADKINAGADAARRGEAPFSDAAESEAESEAEAGPPAPPASVTSSIMAAALTGASVSAVLSSQPTEFARHVILGTLRAINAGLPSYGEMLSNSANAVAVTLEMTGVTGQIAAKALVAVLLGVGIYRIRSNIALYGMDIAQALKNPENRAKVVEDIKEAFSAAKIEAPAGVVEAQVDAALAAAPMEEVVAPAAAPELAAPELAAPAPMEEVVPAAPAPAPAPPSVAGVGQKRSRDESKEAESDSESDSDEEAEGQKRRGPGPQEEQVGGPTGGHRCPACGSVLKKSLKTRKARKSKKSKKSKAMSKKNKSKNANKKQSSYRKNRKMSEKKRR